MDFVMDLKYLCVLERFFHVAGSLEEKDAIDAEESGSSLQGANVTTGIGKENSYCC